ncbi:MAG TPA: DUF3025 domain-containing protein, partial [Candidatus Berkiella sp.]|nr:DUF3025 domain-containing protein [Candidatus Berkiella sp.]
MGYESIATWWNQYEQQFQERWPVIEDYNAWFKQAVQLNALPKETHFSFILQTEQSCYEQDIFKYRTIPSRMQNWHDFFNNITWILYPKTKWAIIQRTHQENINKKHGVVRTKRQNLLAHFDECGMILCSDNPALFEDVKTHAW